MKLGSLLLFCTLLSGCADVDVMTLKPAEAKIESCDLDIYASEAEVPRKFETLCIVEGHTGMGAFDDKSAAGALKIVRPALCRCGADAGVIVESSSAKAGWFTSNAYTATQDQRGNVKVKGVRFVP